MNIAIITRRTMAQMVNVYQSFALDSPTSPRTKAIRFLSLLVYFFKVLMEYYRWDNSIRRSSFVDIALNKGTNTNKTDTITATVNTPSITSPYKVRLTKDGSIPNLHSTDQTDPKYTPRELGAKT